MRGKVISENAYALILCIIKKIEPETALKKMKVKVPNTVGLAIKDSEREKIYDYYYKDNMSLSKIGELYNISRYSVKYYMDKVEIPSKGKGRHAK